MHTKKDASFLLIVALSMLILAYITFVTVYEQILSQNNGFFNVIIFGVVLILVFIFITLLARIITVKADNTEESPVLRVLVFLGIVGIFVFFVYSRIQYTSGILPSDYPVYRAADYFTSGQLVEAKDLHSHLICYPADFVYAFVLSNIFGITGTSSEIFILINIAMMIILAVFLFFNVNLIAGKAYGAVAVIIFMFMPNNSFLVYSYNSELFVAAIFMITLYLYEVLIYKRFKNPGFARIIALICGIFGGLCISSEPVILLSLLVLTVWILSAQRQTVFAAVLPLIIAVITFFGFSFFKSLVLNVGIGKVLAGSALCFVPTFVREEEAAEFTFSEFFSSLTNRLNNPSRFLSDNFYFLGKKDGSSLSANQGIWLKLADQLIFIFTLVLCVLCIVYILRVTYDKIMPVFSVMVTLFFGQLLGGTNMVSYIYFTTILVLIGSTTIYYMYLNHHPDYAVYVTNLQIKKDNEIKLIQEGFEPEEIEENEDLDNQQEELSDEYLIRARALVFVGEDDALYNQIKENERIERINNPIAATRIRTVVNEEGEYDSSEEHLEFFDDLDEKVEIKEVHEVKAIPSTRPVETVKPLLADEYKETAASSYFDDDSTDLKITQDNNMSSVYESKTTDSIISDAIKMSEAGSGNDKPVTNPEPSTEGFVFRKKDSNGTAASIKENNSTIDRAEKKQKKESIFKKKSEKPEKENKNKKSLKDIKPGEPLPNPLDVPKPHAAKDMDFDFDTSGDDDYDF